MKLKCYYIFFLLWSYPLYGTPIDSLYQLLEQTRTHPQKFLTTHLQLADALSKQGDNTKAASHIDTVEKQLTERNFPIVKVHLLLTKGLLAYNQYKDEEALNLFETGYQLNKQYQAGFCVDFCTNLLKVATSEKTGTYLKEGLNCASTIQDTIALQEQLGNLYTQQERYTEAIELYKNNQQLAKSIKDTVLESKAYLNIGNTYLREGKWKKAIEFYLTSASLKEKIGDQQGLVDVHHNLAMVYFEQNQYERSLEYYQKCVHYYSHQQDTAELVEIWSNTASVYIAQQKYEQARELLQQVLALLPQFPNPIVALNTQMNLGDLHLKKEQYEEALLLFKSSLEAAKEQEDYFSLVTVHNFLGTTYCSLKNYTRSIFYYQEALSISQELNLLYEQNLALFGLYKSYDALGNIQAALNWHQQYVVIKDSLYNIATTNRISELQAEYDNREKERVIKALSLENQNIILEKQLQTKQLYLSLLGSALLLSGVGMWWWYRQKKLVHQQEMSDLIKEQEVETLAMVLSAEQKERKRLAKEIHDTMGTFLALLRLQHQSNEGLVDDPTYRERHLIMKDLIKQTTTEMRRITHQMNTGVQFSFNLQHAIEQLVRLIQTLQKIEITFNYMGEDIELSRMIELTLYRVTQESLSNILRHAQATEVTIQFNQSATEITLMIEDNGRGFAPTMPSKGIGLRNMRERVETLEGIIRVDSSPKTGTCIDVQIPIP